MKKMQLIMLAMLVALVPGIASGVSIALDFTGGGSAWTFEIMDAGYPYTLELDGDPTKIGYVQNTTNSGAVRAWQNIVLPAEAINVQLSANVSGYSSWIMLGRFALSTVGSGPIPSGTYWTGVDHMSGVVLTDQPMSLDDTYDVFDGGANPCWVGVEVWKGLASVYQRPDVSQVVLTYDIIPEPSSMALIAFAALALMKRR